jgi:hypothetical protein
MRLKFLFVMVAGLAGRLFFVQSIALPAQEAPHESREDVTHPTARIPLNPEAVPDNMESRIGAALSRIRHPQNRKQVEDMRAGLRMSLNYRSATTSLPGRRICELPLPGQSRATVTGSKNLPFKRSQTSS